MPQSAKSVVLSKDDHRQQAAVLLHFEYDVELANRMKRLKKTQWRQTMKCWYIPDQGTNLRAIQNLPKQENLLTTEIYTHVSNLELQKLINPIDEIISKT